MDLDRATARSISPSRGRGVEPRCRAATDGATEDAAEGPEEPARYSSLAEAGEVAPASFGYRRRSSPPELPPNPATSLMTVANTTAPSTYANNPWPSAVTRIKPRTSLWTPPI